MSEKVKNGSERITTHAAFFIGGTGREAGRSDDKTNSFAFEMAF